MRAASYAGARTVAVAERPDPSPGPGEVRIEVAYTGICGTDLHVFHGDLDTRVRPPQVIGHEMSGVVETVGAGVTEWTPGDAVTVLPVASCGICVACVAGHGHVCQHLIFLGLDAPGAMQERWTVPASLLVRLPPDLPLDRAALVEPTAVAVHDVRRSGLLPGETAVVVGGGPIGVLIATVARRAGAEVVLVEPDAYRLRTARSLGLRALDPAAQDVARAVDHLTAGAGAGVAFEVSGSAAGVETAVDVLAVRGRLVMVAVHGTPRPVALKRFLWRELELRGARLYDRSDFENAVRLVRDGVVPAGTLISRVVPMADAGSAFEALENGDGVMKVLVDCRAG